MYTLFLIGGIGSGKSTAARVLGELGAAVVDLDQVARRAVEEPEILARLSERFGEGVLSADGTLDRAALAGAAFSDPEATRDLDAITHPRIVELLDDRLRLLAQGTGAPRLAVVEVQVAQAMGASRACDEVMALRCPADVRRSRALARGMAAADFDARDSAQISDEARCAMADVVVDSSGDEDGVARALREWARRRADEGWVSPAARDRVAQRPLDAGWLQQARARLGLPSPFVAFLGRHNSGKTTLVTQVISALTRQGLDVGSVKHHGHPGFQIDVEGKDSWRHRRAGATEVAVCSPDQFALIRDLASEMELEQAVRCMRAHDVVVVEGYRAGGLPSVEVMRAASERDRVAARAFCESVQEGAPFTYRPDQFPPGSHVDPGRMPGPGTVAVATDMPAVRRAAVAAGLVALDVNDPGQAAALVASGLSAGAVS